MSRGAAIAVFVENNINNADIIKENLLITGLSAYAHILCLDVAEALSLLGREKKKFDFIFLDPPYLKGLETTSLACITKNELLKPGGNVIIESGKKYCLPRNIGDLEMFRHEKYGDTLLSFYHNKHTIGEEN